MIGRLRGNLTFITPGQVIVDTAGVGYLVNISYNTYYKIAEAQGETTLHIHTRAREDSLELYGFYDTLEKQIFLRLISTSGIGPKLALNVLSGISSEELLEAIEQYSLERLQAVPGIGKKTAERIIVEMKDKITGLIKGDRQGESAAVRFRGIEGELYTDLVSALVNLGYRRKEAEGAANRSLRESGDGSPSLENALKKSLNYLSGNL